MPAPQTLHVQAIDPALSMFAEGVLPDMAKECIAGGVCPVMTTTRKSNKYRTIPRSNFARDVALARQPHTEAPEVTFEWSTDTFSTETYAVGILLSDDELNDSETPQLLEQLAVKKVVNSLLLKHERSFAAKFMTTSVWGTDKAGITDFGQWDDYSGSDPVLDVEGWKRTVEVGGGLEANTLIVGPDVDRALRNHPAILSRMAVTGVRIATGAIIAQILGIERYVVARAKYVTTADGVAESSAAFDFVYGKNILLAHMGSSAGGDLEASAARIFAWGQSGATLPSGNMGSVAIQKIPRPEKKDWKLVGEINFDHKATGSKLGLFASAVVSTGF